MDGVDGRNGTILYRVLDANTNQIIDQGSTIFDMAVTAFTVIATEDDGIFEPGETVFVAGVTVTNTGGMILPPGTIISFPNNCGFSPTTHAFISKDMFYILDKPIMPGGVFTVPFQFFGQIADIAEAGGIGPYRNTMPVVSSATMLTSPFAAGFLSLNTPISYPVQIGDTYAPTQLGRSERGTVTISFRNISAIPYGSQVGERQHLRYSIVFDPKFTVHNEPGLNGANGIEEDIPLIASGQTFSRNFEVEINDVAQFFETVPYKIYLYLRGKRIECSQGIIRLTPNYFPTIPGENTFDVLFITDKQIVRQEFVAYIKLFEGLGLSVNIWDCEKYGGVSLHNATQTRHPISWTAGGYEGKIVVYPMLNQGDDRNLIAGDILSLLGGLNWTASPQASMGSVIFIGAVEPNTFRTRLFDPVVPVPIPEKELREMFVISSPSPSDLDRKCKEFFEKTLSKDTPSRHYLACNTKFSVKKGGLFSKTLLGTSDFKQLPINATDHCYAVDTSVGNAQNFMISDIQDNLIHNQFYVNSNFGRLFNTIIWSLPISRKLRLLKKPTEWLKQAKFVEEGGEIVDYVKALVWGIYHDLFMEVCYKEITGRNTLIIEKDFEENLAEYQAHPECLKICTMLFLAISKLKSDIKWKGMLFSKTKEQKQNFDKFANKMEKILLSNILNNVSAAENIKKDTKLKVKTMSNKYFSFHDKYVTRLLVNSLHKDLENSMSDTPLESAAKLLDKTKSSMNSVSEAGNNLYY